MIVSVVLVMVVGSLGRLVRAGLHAYLRGVVLAEREFIAMDEKLHRVTHGSIFDECDVYAGNDAHVEQMLTQCAVTADTRHRDCFSNMCFF